MKTSPRLSTWNIGLVSALAVLVGLLTAPLSTRGAIYADFDAGETSAEVDGYPGKAGLGWASAWQTTGVTQTSTDMNVITDGDPGYAPLSADGGNYLSINVQSESSTNRVLGVRRTYEDYGSVNLGATHIIRFNVRIDSGFSDVQRYKFFDDNTQNYSSASGATSTYFIRNIGSTWRVYDNNGSTAGGLAIYTGDTYAFEIELDMNEHTYATRILNLDHAANERPGEAFFESAFVNFRGSNYHGLNPPDTAGGTLHFMARMESGTAENPRITDFSIDSIHIIPEPSTAALLLGMGAALMLRKRRS